MTTSPRYRFRAIGVAEPSAAVGLPIPIPIPILVPLPPPPVSVSVPVGGGVSVPVLDSSRNSQAGGASGNSSSALLPSVSSPQSCSPSTQQEALPPISVPLANRRVSSPLLGANGNAPVTSTSVLHPSPPPTSSTVLFRSNAASSPHGAAAPTTTTTAATFRRHSTLLPGSSSSSLSGSFHPSASRSDVPLVASVRGLSPHPPLPASPSATVYSSSFPSSFSSSSSGFLFSSDGHRLVGRSATPPPNSVQEASNASSNSNNKSYRRGSRSTDGSLTDRTHVRSHVHSSNGHENGLTTTNGSRGGSDGSPSSGGSDSSFAVSAPQKKILLQMLGAVAQAKREREAVPHQTQFRPVSATKRPKSAASNGATPAAPSEGPPSFVITSTPAPPTSRSRPHSAIVGKRAKSAGDVTSAAEPDRCFAATPGNDVVGRADETTLTARSTASTSSSSSSSTGSTTGAPGALLINDGALTTTTTTGGIQPLITGQAAESAKSSLTAYAKDPLSRAVKENNMSQVRWLLNNDPDMDINWTDRNGSTPLFHACWNGDPAMVALLLKYQPNVNHVNLRGNVALDMAVLRGHDPIMKLLVEAGGAGIDLIGASTQKNTTVMTPHVRQTLQRYRNNYLQSQQPPQQSSQQPQQGTQQQMLSSPPRSSTASSSSSSSHSELSTSKEAWAEDSSKSTNASTGNDDFLPPTLSTPDPVSVSVSSSAPHIVLTSTSPRTSPFSPSASHSPHPPSVTSGFVSSPRARVSRHGDWVSSKTNNSSASHSGTNHSPSNSEPDRKSPRSSPSSPLGDIHEKQHSRTGSLEDGMMVDERLLQQTVATTNSTSISITLPGNLTSSPSSPPPPKKKHHQRGASASATIASSSLHHPPLHVRMLSSHSVTSPPSSSHPVAPLRAAFHPANVDLPLTIGTVVAPSHPQQQRARSATPSAPSLYQPIHPQQPLSARSLSGSSSMPTPAGVHRGRPSSSRPAGGRMSLVGSMMGGGVAGGGSSGGVGMSFVDGTGASTPRSSTNGNHGSVSVNGVRRSISRPASATTIRSTMTTGGGGRLANRRRSQSPTSAAAEAALAAVVAAATGNGSGYIRPRSAAALHSASMSSPSQQLFGVLGAPAPILRSVLASGPKSQAITSSSLSSAAADASSKKASLTPYIMDPLASAAKNGDIVMAQLCLANVTPTGGSASTGGGGGGATAKMFQNSVNFADRNGSTPLFHATWNGDVPMIELLLRYGADINHKNLRGNIPLDMAILRFSDNPEGQPALFRLLIESGAAVSKLGQTKKTMPLQMRQFLSTLLQEIITVRKEQQKRDAEEKLYQIQLEEWWEDGAVPELKPERVAEKRERLLREHKARIEAESEVQEERQRAAERDRLLRQSAVREAEEAAAAEQERLRRQCEETERLEREANEAAEKERLSKLMITPTTVKIDHEILADEAVAFDLESRAMQVEEIHLRPAVGWEWFDGSLEASVLTEIIEDPLSAAVRKGNLGAIQQLLADEIEVVDWSDHLGNTALFYAAAAGDSDAVALLIEYGADVNVVNLNGEAALDAAIENQCHEVVELLLEKGADASMEMMEMMVSQDGIAMEPQMAQLMHSYIKQKPLPQNAEAPEEVDMFSYQRPVRRLQE